MHYNRDQYPQNLVYEIFGGDYKNVPENTFELCEKFVESLPKDDKEIIIYHFKDGLVYGEIARKLDITREWVRQWTDSIIKKLTYVLFENAIFEAKNNADKENYNRGYIAATKEKLAAEEENKVKWNIEKLGLSLRATNALHRMGCNYVADVLVVDKNNLRKASGIGEKTYFEISESMERIGYSLG